MIHGVRVGRILGIEIRLDPSLLVIFLLISFHLALGVFPAWQPDLGGALTWVLALSAATLFLASILAHELSHSVVARAFGLPVRNITLFLFGGVSNIEREPESAKVEFWMAVVGPLASLVLGGVFTALALVTAAPLPATTEAATEWLAGLHPITTLLLWLGPVNVVLGVFNLLPGFPLDGGRILRSILWGVTGNLEQATRWATAAGQAMGWTFVFLGIGMVFGLQVPIFGTGLIGGLWIAFIGWFLTRAAQASYTQALLRSALSDVPARRIMATPLDTVPPDLTLARFVDEHLAHSDQRAFPVLDGDRLVGLVCLEDVRRVPRPEWEAHPITDVMTPRDALTIAGPEEDAAEVFRRLSEAGVGQIPILDGEHLVGLVRREDIVRWLQLEADLPADPRAA